MDHSAASPTLHYAESGTPGPNVLLLLHAFPLNSSMWQPQLDSPPEGWWVVAPDMRGYGKSPPVRGERLDMDAAADDVASLLTSLGIESAVVCGLSMGGYITFALLRRHRALIRALVLCDTRAAADTAEVRAGRMESAARISASGTTAFNDALLPKLLSSFTRSSRPELEQQVKAMMGDARADTVRATLLGLAARPDSTPLLRAISVPTQVIVGEDDQITPAGEAQLMARGIPGAFMAIVPDAAHLPNLENPAVFNRMIETFLMSVR